MKKKVLILFLCSFVFKCLFTIDGQDLSNLDNQPIAPKVKKKPFNYKAVEAKRKGVPLIVHHPDKSYMAHKSPKILPIWPGFLRFPDNTDVVHGELGYQWAKWAYDGNNYKADPSHLLFGSDPLTLQDASIIARMHQKTLDVYLASSGGFIKENGYILRTTEQPKASNPEAAEFLTTNPTSNIGASLSEKFQGYNRYLTYLATKVLDFNSQSLKPFLTLNYAKSFLEQKSSFGIEVPVMLKINEIELLDQLTEADNNVLARESNFEKSSNKLQDFFFHSYPKGIKEFFAKMLEDKAFSTDEKSRKFGIGDITFFINRKVENNYWDYALVGCGLTIPSAPITNTKHLWPADLGNGGFWQAKAHGAVYWKSTKLWNPHGMAQFVFGFTAEVQRRLSRLIDFAKDDSASNEILAKNLPLGNNLEFAQNLNKEPESKIPALASGPLQAVEYRKGAQISLRLGNVFDQIFIKTGYVDAFYQFDYKFKDSLSFKSNEGSYDTASLVKNTESWSHLMGLGYSYKWSDDIYLEAKGLYTFAGRRTLRNYAISLASQWKF